MPIVQAAANSQGPQLPGTEDKTSTNGVGFDTFLKLLTTQLQNQDPLNPMDGTEFTGQIAQFSSLEQQLATNKYLEDIAAQTDYDVQFLAVSYIGKEALAEGDALVLDQAGESVDFAYSLKKASQVTTIEIYDANTGSVVRNYEVTGEPGDHAMTWDGLNDAGEEVAPGAYRIKISASTSEGGTAGVNTYTYATVKAVAGQGSDAEIQLADNRLVNINDILTVRLAGQESGTVN